MPSLTRGHILHGVLRRPGQLLPTPSPPRGCRKEAPCIVGNVCAPKASTRGRPVSAGGRAGQKGVHLAVDTEFRQEAWGRARLWEGELEPLPFCRSARAAKSQGRLGSFLAGGDRLPKAPPLGLQGPLSPAGGGADLSASRGAVLLASHCRCPGLFLPFVQTFFPLVLVQRWPSLLNYFTLFQSGSRGENHDV